MVAIAWSPRWPGPWFLPAVVGRPRRKWPGAVGDAGRYGVVLRRWEALGLVLAADVVDFRRGSWPLLRGGGDAGMELNEVLADLEEQATDVAHHHVPLLVASRRPQ